MALLENFATLCYATVYFLTYNFDTLLVDMRGLSWTAEYVDITKAGDLLRQAQLYSLPHSTVWPETG